MTTPPCPECGWRHLPDKPHGKVKWHDPSAGRPGAAERAGNPLFQELTIPLVCPKCGTAYEGSSVIPLAEGEGHRERLCEHCRGGDKPTPQAHVTPRPKPPQVPELRRPERPSTWYEKERD